MKKIIILNVLVQSCFLHCMDRPKDGQIVSKNDYFRPINPEVEKRHNVATWHVDFANAVVLNKRNEVSQMLVNAGEDANELVCTASSAYGSILKSTYVEQQPEMRKLLKKYMDDAYLKQCFELEKARLKQTWEFNASQKKFITSSPSAENLVRDFYREDPIKYPLSAEECDLLGIK